MKPCPKDVICIDGNFTSNCPNIKSPVKEGGLYRALSIHRILIKDYYMLDGFYNMYFSVDKFIDLDDINIENSLKEINEREIIECKTS